MKEKYLEVIALCEKNINRLVELERKTHRSYQVQIFYQEQKLAEYKALLEAIRI